MTFTAHGKLIISGEHAAVYGQPALCSGISVGVSVGIGESGELDNFLKNIQDVFSKQTGVAIGTYHRFVIDSLLPVGSGLGSSAAVAYACFQALADMYDINLNSEEYVHLVDESEKYMHGNPSGIDTYAVVHGGLFSFRRTLTSPEIKPIITSLRLQALLIQSGKPKETTKDMIAVVAQNIEKTPSLKQNIENIGVISTTITENFSRNTFDYALIKQNQKLLMQLGVSSPEADTIVHLVEKEGGVAKITGAGGNTGGSGMILTFHEDEAKLVELQKQFSEHSYIITFPME